VPTGVVVLDVDGVVFPGQFILNLARRRGWTVFPCTLADCLFFNLNRLSLERLLTRSFGRLRGLPWEEVLAAYSSMGISPGTRETVAELKKGGRYVVLLSAGVPDSLVKDLATHLGADEGAGIITEVLDGCLTGRVSGELARSGGKLGYVERLLAELGIPWSDVTVVGDDPNNLPLMRRAGRSVGFHATYTVRRAADELIEQDDLREMLSPGPRRAASQYPLHALPGRRPWLREVFRKLLHLTGLFVAVTAPRFPGVVSILLIIAMALYLVCEFWRLNGVGLPLVRSVSRLAMRRRESRESAIAPLTLALGVLFSLWCVPHAIGLACILIACISDSGAALIGSRWGKVPWAYNRFKTVEGSAVFLVSAVVCALVYLPWPQAMLLAAIATFIESLPLQDWDNFVVPAASGLAASLLLF